MNKLLALSCTGAILTSALWLPPASTNAQNTNATSNSTGNSSTLVSPKRTTEPSFLEKINEQINQQYSNLKNRIEGQIQSLGHDFSDGLNQLSQEIQSQVQSQINETIGDLGLPDMVGAGQKIEETISSTKADILRLDPRIRGRNAREDWNRTYTSNQAQSVLGVEGQATMKREQEAAQTAASTSARSADAAQSDIVTQDIMKKIALQNAQTAEVLKLVQTSLQEQNKLTATANVNLSDIAQSLSIEERRKQNEVQENVNAIYRNAAFADGFWSSISSK